MISHTPSGAEPSRCCDARFAGQLRSESSQLSSACGFVLSLYVACDDYVQAWQATGLVFLNASSVACSTPAACVLARCDAALIVPAWARCMADICLVVYRGSVIAIDDAAPRKEDGASAGGSVFPRGSSIPAHDSPQNYNTSSLPMDGIEGLSMGAANGDESMGPARRHPDDRLRNGYKPY